MSTSTFTPEELATLETNPFACRDLDTDLKRNRAAGTMNKMVGLQKKIHRRVRCRELLWKAVCKKHGVQLTRVVGCGHRFCTRCFIDAQKKTMARFKGALDHIAKCQSPGSIIMIKMRFKLPWELTDDNAWTVRKWAKTLLDNLVRRAEHYALHSEHEIPFRSIQLQGIDDEDRLHVSVFMVTSDPSLTSTFHNPFLGVMEGPPEFSWLDRAPKLHAEMLFRRHTSILEVFDEREGLNEAVFNAMRMLRHTVLRGELFVEELEPPTNNSDLPPHEPNAFGHDELPAGVILCKQCNKPCYITIEDKYCRPEKPLVLHVDNR